MPNGDPQDGFFYPPLTLLMDSYRILLQASFNPLYTCDSNMHTLANSEATLFAKQKGSSEKEMQFLFRNYYL